MPGKLIVVSGPSGVGKGTLLARVFEKVGGIRVAVSATTRKPRIGEQDGVQYHFCSDQKFDELIRDNGLLEWAFVHNARYGTPKDEVVRSLNEGIDVVLEIDPQGARQVRQAFPEAPQLFIVPPSPEELRRRLTERGSESPQMIEQRLATAAEELGRAGEYDKVIVNDDLDEAVSELQSYILALRQA